MRGCSVQASTSFYRSGHVQTCTSPALCICNLCTQALILVYLIVRKGKPSRLQTSNSNWQSVRQINLLPYRNVFLFIG